LPGWRRTQMFDSEGLCSCSHDLNIHFINGVCRICNRPDQPPKPCPGIERLLRILRQQLEAPPVKPGVFGSGIPGWRPR
jgi:hypothetical protein